MKRNMLVDRVVLMAALLATPAGASVQHQASVPRMPLAEFKKALEADAIVAIDVRGADAYRAGHIPGTLSVPLDQLEARAAELRAKGKPIVTYCA